MLCATARPLLTYPTTAHFTSRRLLLRPLLTLRRHSLPSTHLKMSSSTISASSAASPPPPETIEHIVLLNVKADTDQSQITAMLSGLNGLISLPEVLHITAGPLLRNRSSSLRFTHMLHSRYLSKSDLAQYSAHPAHMSVVKSNALPICDDIMAVDWVARNLSGPISPRPGSAMRVQFLKLIEGLGEREKEEVWNVIGGLKEKVNSMDDLSFGENSSPGRAKGFSIASIGFFPGVEELDSVEENVEISTEKDKVRDYIDSLVVVDYVVPFPQSASL